MTVPVSILTGFLGSGKTTYLSKVLASPGSAGTLVMINEVGEISIDHLLVQVVDEEIVELSSGCLCCLLRGDLVQALRKALALRERSPASFQRIAIETSGLADPGPILYTMAADPFLERTIRVDTVATVVDAVAGENTLERFAEPSRQIAVADRLLLAKTDLAKPSRSLLRQLKALNDGAECFDLAAAKDPAAILFGSKWASAERGRRWIKCDEPRGGVSHSSGITVHSLLFSRPPTRFELAKMLGALAGSRGEDLLRVKGIVAFADMPDRPFVLNAVQHTLYEPEALDAWPNGDARSRVVIIGHEITMDEILDHFSCVGPSMAVTARGSARRSVGGKNA
jgi:G3E family GTPase